MNQNLINAANPITPKTQSKNKRRRFLIALGILLIVAGGFFYWWLSQPIANSPEESSGPKPVPPTLFSKEDYKIEDRADGKYIVVDKVGLTCKVPGGWGVEFEGTDYPDSSSQYEVAIFSPDIEKKSGFLIKGCEINIAVGTEEKNNQEVKNYIKLIKETPEKSNEIREDYKFEIIKINNHETIKWLSPEKPLFGQSTGIDIPINDKKIIDIMLTFPPNYKEKCSQTWEEFLKTVELK